MNEYTNDYLLNLKVKIFQPVNGYRASTDAVLLSSLVDKLGPQDSVLDVGSGTGAVSLCLAHRFQQQAPQINGIEIQPELAQLSNFSSQENGFSSFLKYVNADINSAGLPFSNGSFSHVITNPPYAFADMPSPNPSKAKAHNLRPTDLTGWIRFCLKMLKPFGHFFMVNRAEALTETLSALNGRAGKMLVIPIYSKKGQNAKRILICAQKDSKAPLAISPGIIVHEADGTYSPEAHKILRDGLSIFEIF